jgi:hypothetical protein
MMTRSQADRSVLTALAVRLSWLSVAWAAFSGTASVTLGVLDHSLAITGVGLNLLGDLAGSLALVWRFGQERRRLHRADSAERVARLVVATSLTVVAAFLAVQSVRRLAEATRPAADIAPILVAAASVVVLPPLARAKRRVGTALGSRALRGDGTLSGVGAAIALLALAGLLVNRTLGWWWADPAAALMVAVVAVVEARGCPRQLPEAVPVGSVGSQVRVPAYRPMAPVCESTGQRRYYGWVHQRLSVGPRGRGFWPACARVVAAVLIGAFMGYGSLAAGPLGLIGLIVAGILCGVSARRRLMLGPFLLGAGLIGGLLLLPALTNTDPAVTYPVEMGLIPLVAYSAAAITGLALTALPFFPRLTVASNNTK